MKNKFLYVFFAAVTLILCFVFSASAGFDLTDEEILALEEVKNLNECYAAGDADGNGKVEAVDARYILRASVALEKPDAATFIRADADSDGKITASDARYALRLSVGLEKAPEHTVEDIIIKSASCSENGLTVKLCTRCMKIYAKIETPAKENMHIPDCWETAKKATCTEKGVMQLKCRVCDKVLKDAEIPLKAHSGEWVYPEGKSCFDPVPRHRTCEVCGKYEENVENPPAKHSYEWVDIKEKTCLEDGIQAYKCKRCGDVKTEKPIPSLGGHFFIYDSVIKAPTCEETGLNAKKCATCGYTEGEYATEALGHNYDNRHYKVTKETTCAEEGTADAVCSLCGEAKELTLKKLPHTITDKWTVTLNSDCENEGERKGTCRYCGPVTEKIPAKGHTVKKWTTVKKATCTETGLMEGSCSVCGNTAATKDIEKLPHNYDEDTWYWTSGVPCKENGGGYIKCVDCGKKRDIIILQTPCTNENFGKTKVVTEATCTTKMTAIDVCDFCKKEIEGTIKSTGLILGHEFKAENWKTKAEATCTEDGLKECKCTRCDEVESETVAALGHEFKAEEWKVTKEASCTEDGVAECECTRGDEVKKESIPALGHTEGEWEVSTPATCSEAGEEDLHCTECKEVLETKEIAKAEHTPEYVVLDEPYSSTADGITIKCKKVCSVCEETLSDAEDVVRIAVSCMDENISVEFNEYTDVTSGGSVYFNVEGAGDDLIMMFTYGEDGNGAVEGSTGLYYFTIPEDLSETETITIVIATIN